MFNTNLTMKCSECNGEVVKNENRSLLICKKCGRKIPYGNKQTKLVDMNDETEKYDQVLFG